MPSPPLNYEELLLTESNINSLLLTASENNTNIKDLLLFLLYKFTDKRELLNKVKILSLNKKIIYEGKDENEIEDLIVNNIFCALEFEEIKVPYDFIRILKSKNDSFIRKVINWYFMNKTIKKTTKIYKMIIKEINNVGPNNNETKQRNIIINSLTSNESQGGQNDTLNNISIANNNELHSYDIQDVDPEILKRYDLNLQRGLSHSKHINIEILNRYLDLIKILLKKNGSTYLDLFYELNYLNNIHGNKARNIVQLIKFYISKLRLKNNKKLMRSFFENLEQDGTLIKYTNSIYKYYETRELIFDWNKFFKSASRNETIKDYNCIEFRSIPSRILYRYIYKKTCINRYIGLLRNVIKNDIDLKSLKIYESKFETNLKLSEMGDLMKKRIEQLTDIMDY